MYSIKVSKTEPRDTNLAWVKPLANGYALYLYLNGAWTPIKLVDDNGTDSTSDDKITDIVNSFKKGVVNNATIEDNKLIISYNEESGKQPVEIPIVADINVDSSLSSTSENPVQNKVIKAALDNKLSGSQLATINGSRIDQGGNVTIVAAEGQTITIDAAPTAGSNNAVSSGGVYPLVQELNGLAPLTEYVGQLESTSAKISNVSTYRYMVVPVKPSDVVKLTAGTGGCFYYVVSGFTFNPTLPYDLILATGETSKHNADEGATSNMKMPTDAAYIIIRGSIANLTIGGRSYDSSLKDVIVDQMHREYKDVVVAKSFNLYDKTQELRIGYIDNSTGRYTKHTNANYQTTQNIPIKSGVWYCLGSIPNSTSNQTLYVAARDGDNNIPISFTGYYGSGTPTSAIKFLYAKDSNPLVFKVDAADPYITFCVKFTSQSANDTVMLIEGTADNWPNSYIGYQPLIPEDQIPVIPITKLSQSILELPNKISNLENAIYGSRNKKFLLNTQRDSISKIQSSWDDGSIIEASFSILRTIDHSGGHSECLNIGGTTRTKNGQTTIMISGGDEIAPVYDSNVGYLGANHGCDKFYACTVTGHNKTYADIGSKWSTGSTSVIIADIRDSNTLILAGVPATSAAYVYPLWRLTTPTTGEYTHVSGGVNTSSFTVSASSLAQGKPIMKLDETKIFVDDTEVSESGNYEFSRDVVISQNYKVANMASVINALIANAGTFTDHPIYKDLDGIDFQWKLSISYIWKDAAKLFVAQTLTYLQNSYLGYFGFIQSLAGSESSQYSKLYIPKVLPYNGLDFRTNPTFNTTTITNGVDLTSEYWENPNLPPDRFVYNNEKYVNNLGYLYDYGVGGNNRKNNISRALNAPSSSLKLYMMGIDFSGIKGDSDMTYIPAGSSYSAVAYRIITNIDDFNLDGKLSINCFEYDNKYYLYLDFNAAGIYEIEIPSTYIGKTVEVFEKSSNVTLLTQLTSNTIMVKVDSASPMYGYLVGQIKK